MISVSDKTGIVEFARELQRIGVEILSTGGTAKTLRQAGISVKDVSELTGAPEMLGGRVKTLDKKIHGGLLFVRGDPEHERQARKYGIPPIDLVVVSLYPFEQTIAKEGTTVAEAIEQIDIGGPAMLRSAAKNHASVTVVVDPGDYEAVLRDIHEHDGDTCEMFRWKLAIKAFETTALYDTAIAEYLHAERMKVKGEAAADFPETLIFRLKKAMELRYGENPHQKAALYGDFGKHFEQLHGKELSYNNILDLDAATALMGDFEDEPTVAILKHTNPCGVAQSASSLKAWQAAYETDPQASFGGIIITNFPLDARVATTLSEIFSEVIIAPGFEPEALAVLQKKKNLRLIRNLQQRSLLHTDLLGSKKNVCKIRTVTGGMVLMQEHDARLISATDFKIVTKRQPTEGEIQGMLFAWRVVKHVKSNAIVFARAGSDSIQTLGIGAGQMSRVDSVKIAIWKAGEAKRDLRGSACASDAFFPFPDGLIAAAQAGATAIIQPGGSIRDAEVIAAADERNVAMVFTGVRHFRH